MASENETVAEIVSKMKNSPLCWLTPEGIPQMYHDNDELSSYADRIEAAHKREVEKLRGEIAGLREKMGDDDLLKMARDIEKLNAKLKVAEEALEFMANEEIDDDYSTVAVLALAAIRK